MAIFDLFGGSWVLVALAIVILAMGGLFAYLSYRMGEQDFKLMQMANLIHMLGGNLTQVQHQFDQLHQSIMQKEDDEEQNASTTLQYASQLMDGGDHDELISVSDGAEEEEEWDTEEDDVDDNDDDDVDYLTDEDEEERVIEIGEEAINLEEPEAEAEAEVKEGELKVLKLDFTADNESAEPSKPTTYKQMSIKELRKIASEQGIEVDTSKMKKNELVKLLSEK